MEHSFQHLYRQAAEGKLGRLNERWSSRLVRLVHILLLLGRQAKQDQITTRAAMLAFWTTVALVPLLVLTFAFTKPIGIADKAIRNLLYQSFLATGLSEVGPQLESVLDQADLGAVGVVGVVSLLLIGSQLYFHTERAYNLILQTRVRRGLLNRFFQFYAALTLAVPLIAGGFVATERMSDLPTSIPLQNIVSYVLPSILTALALVVALRALPSTPISWRSVLWGGLTSALLFEAAKRGFGAYTGLLGTQDSMTLLYGSLGLLPVFLLWINVLWIVVLLGVEIAYISEHRDVLLDQQHRIAVDPRAARYQPDGFFALAVMGIIARRFLEGQGATCVDVIVEATGAEHRHVQTALDGLEEAGLIVETEDCRFLPARSLHHISGAEVLAAWRATKAPSTGAGHAGAPLVEAGEKALAEALDAPLAGLVGVQEPPVPLQGPLPGSARGA